MDVTQKSETQIFTTEFSELSVVEQSLPLKALDPVLDQGPYKLINRKRQIADFTHTVPSPSTPGFSFDIRPYTRILQRTDPAILDKFEMIKANVRITVNVTCPPTTFGFALVAWFWGDSRYAPFSPVDFNMVLQTSSMNHYLLPLSTSASVEFVIPYKHIYPYYRMIKSGGEIDIVEAGLDPRVRILTLVTDNNTADPASVSYDVYGAFENTHVARLGAPLVETVTMNQLAVGSREQTALTNAASAIASSLVPANVAAAGNAIVQLKSAYDYYSPSMYKMIQTISDTKDMVSEKYGMLTQRGKETESEVVRQEYEEPPPEVSSIDTEVRGDHTGVKQSYFGDIARTAINNNCNILDVTSPQIPLGVDGTPHRDYSLQDLVSIPTINNLFTFTSSTAQGETWNFPINPVMSDQFTLVPYSYGAFYSSFFRYMKTDVRLSFHVACSPLVSARLESKINYREEGTTSYEAITAVHYINGPSTFTIDVPYVYWKNVIRRDTRFATVTIKLLVPPTNTTIEPSRVHVVVYTSLQNTKFFSPQSWVSPIPPGPLVQKKEMEKTKPRMRKALVERVAMNMNVRELHKNSVSSNIVKSSVIPCHMNEVKSLRTLMARFDTINVLDTTNKIDRTPTLNMSSYSMPVCAITPFAFYSGSREFKVYDGNANPTELLSYWVINSNDDAKTSVAQGTAATDTRVWNFLDIIVPWLVDSSCLYTHASDLYDNANVEFTEFTTTANALDGLFRFGPDFGVSIVNFLPHPDIWA